MSLAVSGDERHPATLDVADEEVVTGVAERRGDLDPLGLVEELVEPGAADQAEVCAWLL